MLDIDWRCLEPDRDCLLPETVDNDERAESVSAFLESLGFDACLLLSLALRLPFSVPLIDGRVGGSMLGALSLGAPLAGPPML